MSEEEKKAIESLIEIREFGNLSSHVDTKINQLNAIDTILNLIEKQQIENDLTTVYLNGVYDGEKKVEYKIKEKIEKIDEEIKVKREIAKNPPDRVSGRLLTDSIIELEKTKKVLQSFLERE